MLQILGFRAPGKANLPGTLGRHSWDLVCTFRAGCFLKSTVPAFSSFSDQKILRVQTSVTCPGRTRPEIKKKRSKKARTGKSGVPSRDPKILCVVHLLLQASRLVRCDLILGLPKPLSLD